MKFAVHQPNFLPYLGFFDKIRQVDIFVILDDVQFTSPGFTNRNRIKTPTGSKWLNVPIQGDKKALINQILVSEDDKWRKSHLTTLKHMYGKSKYYKSLEPFLLEIYTQNWKYLVDFNFTLLKWCFKLLNIHIDVKFSSSLQITAKTGTERILEICKKLDSSEYLSGVTGRKYLNLSRFEKEGIKVSFHEFNHPIYPQRFGKFISNLSVIDYLMNAGPHEFWKENEY